MDQEKTQAQSKQEQIAKFLEKAKKDGEIKMEEVSSILQEIGADAAREDAFFEELENSGPTYWYTTLPLRRCDPQVLSSARPWAGTMPATIINM